jgi:hypothetical protein
MSLSRALLVNQGLGGTIGFLSGFRGVRGRGKRHVVRLLDAAGTGTGNELAARRLLSAAARVTLGDDTRLGTSDLMSRLAGARWRKVIASGGSVAATIERGSQRSMLVAELSRPTEISRIRIFADE